MKRKGKYAYIPPNVLDEAENISASKGLFKQADALKEMARYSQIGREVEVLRSRMFPFIDKKVSKKKKKGFI